MTHTIDNNLNGNGKADTQPVELTPEQQLDLEKATVGTDESLTANNDAEKTGEETETVTKAIPRRLVVVYSPKGGSGKSTWTRGYMQTCIDANREIVAVDADNSNPDLLRYYGKHCPIQQLNIFKDGSIDKFFNQIYKLIYPQPDIYNQLPPSQSLFLLELPPQSTPIFKDFIEMGFLETSAIDYNIRVTIVFVMSTVSDSVNQLINLYGFCGNEVDYVIVKNLYHGDEDEFSVYSDSQEIKNIKESLALEEIPLIEITMPKLIELAYEYLDKNSYTFSEAITKAHTENPAAKMRIRSWLRTFKQQISLAKHLLGLEGIDV